MQHHSEEESTHQCGSDEAASNALLFIVPAWFAFFSVEGAHLCFCSIRVLRSPLPKCGSAPRGIAGGATCCSDSQTPVATATTATVTKANHAVSALLDARMEGDSSDHLPLLTTKISSTDKSRISGMALGSMQCNFGEFSPPVLRCANPWSR